MSDRAKNVMVSFSKRRSGLFRKASELCTKCHAQVAVLVVSPAGNPFAFGHPSVDQLLRRASPLGAGVETGDAIDAERQRSKARVVEGLKDKVKMMKKNKKKKEEAFEAWIDRKIEACKTVEELETLKLECLALRDKITQKLSDDESFLGGQEGFAFGHNDDVVLDFSCPFEDHGGYNGCDDDNLLPLGAPSDAPLSAEKNDGSFSMGKYVEVAMGQENDTSFTAETVGSTTTEGGCSVPEGTTEYDDDVFDFLGQISCGFDQDFWY